MLPRTNLDPRGELPDSRLWEILEQLGIRELGGQAGLQSEVVGHLLSCPVLSCPVLTSSPTSGAGPRQEPDCQPEAAALPGPLPPGPAQGRRARRGQSQLGGAAITARGRWHPG